MRNISTFLKLHCQIICLIVLTCISSSCNDCEDLDRRLSSLESRFEQLNNDLAALQQLVFALQNNISVISVTDTSDGYDVALSNGTTIRIKHGKDGINGTSPQIGVKQADDGLYYWIIRTDHTATWLTDENGNKIAVTGKDGQHGITPLLQIDADGYWMVSYDNGASYNYLLDSEQNRIPAKGDPGDPFFQAVTEDPHFVYFTLSDGTVIKIPKQVSLSIDFDMDDDVAVFPGSTISVGYTISGGTSKNVVKAFGQNGWSAKVSPYDAAGGTIRITAPDAIKDDEIIVLVYDGVATTIMATIECVQGIIELMDNYVDVPYTGGSCTITIRTNIRYRVAISDQASEWIRFPEQDTRALRTDELTFICEKNSGPTRCAIIELQDDAGCLLKKIGISQPGERTDYDALCALYEALGGDDWLHNDNWCSENKMDSWYGVTCANGRVTALSLEANGLRGTIPDAIGELDSLQVLNLFANELEGGLPHTMSSLMRLGTFNCRYNFMDIENIESEIAKHPEFESWKLRPQSNPEQSEIFTALMTLYEATDGDHWINKDQWGSDAEFAEWYGVKTDAFGHIKSIHLQNNNLHGPIPDALGKIATIQSLLLYGNDLSGTIPDVFSSMPSLATLSLQQNKLSGNIPQSLASCTQLGFLSLSDNRLEGPIPNMFSSLPRLTTLYLQKNNLTGNIPESLLTCSELKKLDLSNNCFETTTLKVPNEKIASTVDLFRVFPQKKDDFRFFVDSQIDGTADVHADGSWELYQNAEEGEGIDLFIVGEGYDAVENTIGGTAEYWMKRAAQAAFAIPPMNRLKKYYNVILVYAHSAEKGISLGSNTRDSKFKYSQPKPLESSSATVERATCIKFLGESTNRDLNNSTGIVVVNSPHNSLYGGICWHNANPKISLALIPTRNKWFSILVWHEAVGHGIGRLGDEYGNKGDYDHSQDTKIAYHANLDLESDPRKIKWSPFIFDPRYAHEGIGVYEGGKNFKTGVYRPTETSIMRDTSNEELGFNAPSRAGIYEQTMKLAFPGWKFDYEEFVTFDFESR